MLNWPTNLEDGTFGRARTRLVLTAFGLSIVVGGLLTAAARVFHITSSLWLYAALVPVVGFSVYLAFRTLRNEHRVLDPQLHVLRQVRLRNLGTNDKRQRPSWKAFLEMVRQNPHLSDDALSQLCGVSLRKVRKARTALEREGLIASRSDDGQAGVPGPYASAHPMPERMAVLRALHSGATTVQQVAQHAHLSPWRAKQCLSILKAQNLVNHHQGGNFELTEEARLRDHEENRSLHRSPDWPRTP